MDQITIPGYSAESVRRLAHRCFQNLDDQRVKDELQYVCDLSVQLQRQDQQAKRNGTYTKTNA